MRESKLLVVVEDDSRVSRVVRDELEGAFPGWRVEIAGSAAKAKMFCERFHPALVIWDGLPNERDTLEAYVEAIPDEVWPRTVVISGDGACQEVAKRKGARACLPKEEDALHSWAERLVEYIRSQMRPRKGK